VLGWLRRRPRPTGRHHRRAPQQHVTPAAAATSPPAFRHRLGPPTEPGLLAAVPDPDAAASADTVRIVAVPAVEQSGRHSVRAIAAARAPAGPRTLQLHAVQPHPRFTR
jgi:hypothetical protein